MMTFKDQCAAMDDMAGIKCSGVQACEKQQAASCVAPLPAAEAKALQDLSAANAKCTHYERMVSAGEVQYDPNARCYRERKDAEMVLEFVRRASRHFDHAAEAQALAGIRVDLRTGEVVA